jgi:hypothetical protein
MGVAGIVMRCMLPTLLLAAALVLLGCKGEPEKRGERVEIVLPVVYLDWTGATHEVTVTVKVETK